MMALKKGYWLSIAIRLGLVATVCLSWNHYAVEASNTDAVLPVPVETPVFEPPPVPRGPPGCGSYCYWMPEKTPTTFDITDETLEKLAQDMLTEIFEAKHRSQIDNMLNTPGALEQNEPLAKSYFELKDKFDIKDKLKEGKITKEEAKRQTEALAKRAPLTEADVRGRLVQAMGTVEKGYQTIAIGVHPGSKTVVVAGNIKELSYDNIAFVTRKKSPTNMFPWIKSIGIQEPDYVQIRQLIQETGLFDGYKIVVITPSPEELKAALLLEVAKKNAKLKPDQDKFTVADLTSQEILNAQAHFFHAEMQIKAYFRDVLDGIKMMASKPFCMNCGNEIKKKANRLIRFVNGFASKFMRWLLPTIVHGTDITHAADSYKTVVVHNKPFPDGPQSAPASRRASFQDETDTATAPRRASFQDETEHSKGLSSYGGRCGGARRRRRSTCSRPEDYTEVLADEFQRKLGDLPEADQGKLLSLLDEVGTDKLKGSESVKDAIKSKWRKWKSSVVKGVMGALSKGAIISHLFGPKSSELSKTAISPKLLTESLDIMHKENIKSAAEDVKSKGGRKVGDKPQKFATSYKAVKYINMAMIGKNFIGGMLNGDMESLITMGTLLGSDKVLTKVGQTLTAKGAKLAEAGAKTVGGVLKAAGPLLGTATSAFSIYSLVGHVNQIVSLKETCKNKDNIFQERLHKDCRFDMDVAIANTVTDVVGIVSSVLTTAVAIAEIFAYATGPLGIIVAAIDAAVSIGLQIYAAARQVAKVDSSLVTSLSGKEKFVTGARAFIGMQPPKHIQDLLDTKASYNAIVAQAVEALKSAQNYRTYVLPTNHTRNQIQVNCRNESKPTNGGRVLTGIFSFGLSEIYYTRPVEKCDTQQEYEEDSEGDFQNWWPVNKFRVEPDEPSWGALECMPNSKPGRKYPNDPEVVNRTYGYLCHNLIAMSAQSRSGLPVLVDLKDGTDSFLGFPDRRHVFLVGAGLKNFIGGSSDDVFVINSFPFRGHLDGAGGKNTLILDGDRMYPSAFVFGRPYEAMPRVTINLSSCDKSSSSSCESQFKNFQQVTGWSKKPDSIVTNCALTFVDSNGGHSLSNLDEITIPSLDCNARLTVQLRFFTKLDNFHRANGVFTYQVEFATGIQVNLDPEKNVHQFVFTNDIVTARLSYRSGYLLMMNERHTKAFKCNYVKSTTSTLLLMSQQGLLINFDPDSDSFYGLVPPTDGKMQEVTGLVNYPNRFIISTNATLNLTGGSKEDIFSLTGPTWPTGSINGSGGFDTIIMQQDFQPGAVIAIDLPSNVLSPGDLRISNIQSIIGRQALSEVINGSCELKYLDLKGGNANESDFIQFSPHLSCTSEMVLIVRQFTSVENLASSGTFNYQIRLETSATQTNSIQVDLEAAGSAMHRYIFLKPPSSLREVKFDQQSNELEIYFETESWNGMIPMERSKIYLEDQFLLQVLPEVQGSVRVQSNTSASVISGLRTYPNTFVLGMTTRDSRLAGGRVDDNFFITSENVYGKLDGGEGTNTLYLADSAWNGRSVIMDVVKNSLALVNGNETEYQLEFMNMQRLFGREGQVDIIMPDCSTELIDSKGGGNETDWVLISSLPECDYSLGVAIRPSLIVMNDATEGEFKYEGDFRNGGGSTSIFLTFTPYTNHKVYLDMDSHEYNDLKLEDGRVNLTSRDGSQFSVDFFIPDEAESHTQPSISFRDGLELKIFGNGLLTATLFGTLRSLSPSDMLEENIEGDGDVTERNRRAADDFDWRELIQSYRRTAKEAQTSVIMKTESDTLVSIGSGGNLDIFTAVPGYLKNILVCNSANQTIYRIANGSSNIQIIFDLESPGPKLLDLTPIIKDDFKVLPTLRVLGTDLQFQIKDVEITIEGLADPSYGFLTSWQVLLRERFLNIEEDSGSFQLVAEPLVIDPKTVDSFVVHMPSLEPGMKIVTASNNDSKPIKYEAVKQGDNLVFTNLFQQDSSDDVASSVVFYDFYNEKEPEALHEKRVVFEVEAGVTVNVTMETGENLPTFEQREYEAFEQINPLFFIVPVFAILLTGTAWLYWHKKCKWHTFFKHFKRKNQLVLNTRRPRTEKPVIRGILWRSQGKPTEYNAK